MTRTDFINRFKNHINIDGNNHVAYAAATLVEVFINSHIVINTLIMKWFISIWVELLSMRRINTGVHRVCQIEFTHRDGIPVQFMILFDFDIRA